MCSLRTRKGSARNRHRSAIRRPGWAVMALACGVTLGGLSACRGETSTGPGGGPADDRGGQLTARGYLRNGPEWSLDGTELFVNSGGLAPAGEAHQLLAINVQTGVTRVVVDNATCPVVEDQGPVVTTAGLVYLLTCGGASQLRLHRPDGSDTLLAPGADWVMRMPDPSRFVYGYQAAAPCSAPCYTITVMDLAAGQARQVPLKDLPVWPTPNAISPDGTEMLFYPSGQPSILYRLSLVNGSWTTTDRSDWTHPSEIVGWSLGGLWAVLRLDRGAVGDALSGTVVAQLPDLPQAVTADWHARGYTGTIYGLYHQSTSLLAPDGGALALWSTECLSVSRDTRSCDAARYTVWWHDLQTHESRRIAYGTASAAAPGGGDPYWQTFGGSAVSPDGRAIAYVMQGDIYVRALP